MDNDSPTVTPRYPNGEDITNVDNGESSKFKNRQLNNDDDEDKDDEMMITDEELTTSQMADDARVASARKIAIIFVDTEFQAFAMDL